jgi:hypothetical protein
MNFGGFRHSFPLGSGPRPSLSFGSGRGVRFDWSGLHERQPFQIDPNRVAIQKALRYAVNEQGETVVLSWLPPEFTSHKTALRLIGLGQARFCGLSAGGEEK